MKLSVCVQTDEVEKQVPVALFIGNLAQRAAKAGAAGAHGLELMTVDPKKLDAAQVRATLGRNGLQAAAVGSGAIAFATGLTLLHPDAAAAARARALLDDLVDFAAAVDAPLVTIGSFRGKLALGGDAARETLAAILRQAGDRAARQGVRLAVEAANHYELDFVNSASEGVAFLSELNHPAVGLLLDTFHMNIEESSWEGAFRRAAEAGVLWHVHVGDNNRLPPGRGMIDFRRVLRALAEVGYKGYLSAELLARPDGDAAGRESLAHLRPLLEGLP
jgi:sugar phosphate isomerase/epimerase